MLLGAIDIGGTKIAVGIGDERGAIVTQTHRSTQELGGPETACDWMAETLVELCRDAHVSVEQLEAIGIGSPGPFKRGKLVHPSNLPDWDQADLSHALGERLHRPTMIQNDASATALGEWRFGRGEQCANMVYVTVSTGVGAGFIINGQPYWGATGNAGELGHVPIDPQGILCHCGRRGCLETVASGTAIARMGEEQKAKSPLLASQSAVTAPAVFAAWEKHDPVAEEIIESAARAMGTGLSWLINLIDPDRIVLGGGVMREGSAFLDRIEYYARTLSMPTMGESVQMLLADDAEDAGLRGALAVAIAALDGERR